MSHEFLLPNELGWEANDEISRLVDKWHDKLASGAPGKFPSRFMWEVSKAELIDDIYAVVKKYQAKKKGGKK